MADLRAEAALSDDEREFRRAVVDGLTELIKATQQLREQNAADRAMNLAHREETERRIGELERRDEKAADKAEAHQIGILQQQIKLDWKIISLMVMGAYYVLQTFSGVHLAIVR